MLIIRVNVVVKNNYPKLSGVKENYSNALCCDFCWHSRRAGDELLMFIQTSQSQLQVEHLRDYLSTWHLDLEMPLKKHIRATPGWDHLSPAPSGAAFTASLLRLLGKSCCLETTSFYKGLRGETLRGLIYVSALLMCPAVQTAGLGGGREGVLIRQVCSCVCLAGDTIPAWSSFQKAICLWSLPVSVTEEGSQRSGITLGQFIQRIMS